MQSKQIRLENLLSIRGIIFSQNQLNNISIHKSTTNFMQIVFLLLEIC